MKLRLTIRCGTIRQSQWLNHKQKQRRNPYSKARLIFKNNHTSNVKEREKSRVRPKHNSKEKAPIHLNRSQKDIKLKQNRCMSSCRPYQNIIHRIIIIIAVYLGLDDPKTEISTTAKSECSRYSRTDSI